MTNNSCTLKIYETAIRSVFLCVKKSHVMNLHCVLTGHLVLDNHVNIDY